ncbi:MAG: LysR family glycine cleavage system transcriptional activator [Oleispira sp.]|jgi:LysR family glycine cleavage system transcriptional activator
MNYKSQHLAALPIFEAAARHLNLRKAAEELHVTPSAVSQQMKNLEGLLGEQLFDRSSKLLTLTKAGENFYLLAHRTLKQYQYEFNAFQRSTRNLPLRLTTTPFVASEVLIPGLHEYPDTDLRIETSEAIIDLEEEDCSFAVRIGKGDWPGCRGREIIPMSVKLTCSPSLLEKIPYKTVSDLKNFPVIHASTVNNHWQGVSEFLGIDLSNNKQIYFDNYNAAVSATEQGLGLLVTLIPISNKRISNGSLTIVYDNKEHSGLGFYFVERSGAPSKNSDAIFAWVMNQFDKFTKCVD